MKIKIPLLALLALTGCAQTTPKLDTAPIISQVESLKSQNNDNHTPIVNVVKVQPVNITKPCLVALGLAPNSPQPETKWYGDCNNGYAEGLGLSVLINEGQKIFWVEEYQGSGIPVDYGSFPSSGNFVTHGVLDAHTISANNMLVNTENGYASLINVLQYVDIANGREYSTATNLANGLTFLISRYVKSGLTIKVIQSNDSTVNVVAEFDISAKNTLIFKAVKLQNGQVVSNINGTNYDASAMLPYFEQEFATINNLAAKANMAKDIGKEKVKTLAYAICQKKNRPADVSEFCNIKPFESYKAEFVRSSEYYKRERALRMQQIQNATLLAIQQQQLQQQQLQALNQSMADLNRTAQNMQASAINSMQSYTPPTPSVPVYNQPSIYTCQGISNWTYCRQQR